MLNLLFRQRGSPLQGLGDVALPRPGRQRGGLGGFIRGVGPGAGHRNEESKFGLIAGWAIGWPLLPAPQVSASG